MQIPRKRGRPSKADVAAKAAAEAEAKTAAEEAKAAAEEAKAAEAAEVEAAAEVEVVTIPVVSVSPARKRRKQDKDVLRAVEQPQNSLYRAASRLGNNCRG